MADTPSTTGINHLGFIVDGNRRWGQERGLRTLAGHRKGAERLKKILKRCAKLDIPYASAYVFSTENWKRDDSEVDYLMDLFIELVERDLDELYEENVQLVHIGSRVGVPKKVLDALDKAIEKTKHNDGMTFGFCFNYGGQQEIVDALKSIVQSGVYAHDINSELIESQLYAPDIPPLDLIIRTSGEQRLSNFMTWRSTYAELYFTDTKWPDFDEIELDEAIEWFQGRNRRHGGN